MAVRSFLICRCTYHKIDEYQCERALRLHKARCIRMLSGSLSKIDTLGSKDFPVVFKYYQNDMYQTR